jgi:hypothetical protein
MRVTLTVPIGSPMALLCPKAPFRAVPEYVIEFSESTPIAFAAEAMTELAFCVAVLVDSTATRSAASVSVLRIRASKALA